MTNTIFDFKGDTSGEWEVTSMNKLKGIVSKSVQTITYN